MKQKINLGAETIVFVRKRMEEVLGEDPQNIYNIEMNIKEVKEQIFRLFYDYQVIHGWPHVAVNTADLLGFSEMQVHRLAKKRLQKK